jgi:retron-type reverse transcriptase
MHARERVARNLAAAFLADAWTSRALLKQAATVLGRRARRLQRRLVAELIEATPDDYPPSPDWLVAFLLRSHPFNQASKNRRGAHVVLTPPRFAPAERFAGLDVPKLAAPGDLAQWLDISIDQLDWLSDARRQQGRTDIPVLQHYRYSFVPKRNGPPRLIEAPKPKLMAIQRRILHAMLDAMPAHDCAHGFVADRSCLSAAQIHAGEQVVMTVDLKDFFLNIRMSRVHAIFRSLGYPWALARALTGLCSASTPMSVFTRLPPTQRHDWLTQKIYQAPHLPQGAPTSPALANLAAFRLDMRLAALARAYGAHYTRYADDLAFSGDHAFATRTSAFLTAVESITHDEGFLLNSRKTRVMRRGGCQRITGIVVNDHVNVPRTAYDKLKAILYNCRKNGPNTQNRAGLRDFRAHLEGRVAWVEQVNTLRGQRLRRIFDEIRW